MLETSVTRLLGIKYPIVQGAMLWLSPAELAASVSNAGGLGIISSASFLTPEDFRREVRRAKELTDKPFAVNISILPSRRPIPNEGFIRTAAQEGVKIIETSGRSPEPYMPLLKESRAVLMHKAARIKDLLKVERLGFDVVTIVGHEAGGRPGMDDTAITVLAREAVAAVKIPVIAGGGLVDGRGLVAALALGAGAVQMGTRFMLCRECPLHPRIKEFMLQKRETDTLFILKSYREGARVLNTEYAARVAEMEAKGATLDDIYPFISGDRTRASLESGDANGGLISCGQGIGLIDSVLPASEIIEGIMRDAERTLERLRTGNKA